MRLSWQTGFVLSTLLLLGIMPRYQTLTFQQELAGSDGFGQAVASANNLVVGGAPLANGTAGSLLVYERHANGEWTNSAELFASDALQNDGLGMAVAASDDWVVGGAPFASDNSGAVYIFAPDEAGEWQETARLTASDPVENARFGIALSASSNRIVVGAPGNGTSGAAYVFAYDGANWIEESQLVPFDETGQFGAAVAIDGDQIIVGAPQDNLAAGAAYVYLRTANGWQIAAKLISMDSTDGDEFGGAVAISGQRALVGASQADGSDENSGAAYVFVSANNTWTEEFKLTEAGGQFGHAVALGNNLALVGAPGTGSAYFYMHSSGGWNREAQLGDAESNGQVGGAVAVTGYTLSVGATNAVQTYIVPGSVGSLSLRMDNLVAGGILGVQLSDADLNRLSDQIEKAVIILNTPSGEQETLTLTETGADSGIFAGNIQSLITSAPLADDGILDVQAGDRVVALYDDIHTETGGIIELRAEADVTAPTQTPTPTNTATPTLTPSVTDTPSITPTDTPTATNTDTPTDVPTNTPTDTPTLTDTPTDVPTDTPEPSDTPTDIPTDTDTPTDTPTNTPTNTATATETPTDVPTNTPEPSPTDTPTATDTPTVTPSATPPNGADGTLIVAPEFIQPGAALSITLEDADLNHDPLALDTAVITIHNSIGQVTMHEMTETGLRTGIFTGEVETRMAGSGADSGGALDVAPGDVLTIYYDDARTFANGTAMLTETLRVVGDFYVAHFVLVDAETNVDLMTLRDGDVIDLAQLPTRSLSIRADTQPAEIGSVIFDLDNGWVLKVENRAPYALGGDNPLGIEPGGDYLIVLALTVGQHRLVALPFSAADGGGERGTGLAMEFEIINSAEESGG